jgi:hypothetical protein
MELWTAFLLGVVGSLHCAGMCGPLLLALAKAQPRTRRQWVSRACYHFGRLVSYCLLGLALGSLGHAIGPAGFQRWLSIGLGVALLAGLMLSAKASISAPMFRWISFLKSSMCGLLQQNSLASQALLGTLNGLLPCGLVYVAAAGATATGHPETGAAYMALFGLGTCPMMLGVHFVGQRLPLPTRLPLGNVVRTAVLLMAALLILRGLEIGIPFVSPGRAAVNSGHCH